MKAAQQPEVDRITQEVITEGLVATMAEMRANVMRAAYSALIGLVQDFSCGLFNPDGELIAQGPDHPGHIVPLPWGIRSCMEDLGDDLAPGDVVILNDPYRGGTHLNDVTVLWPLFVGGELFCFPAVRAHWADVGGISPGSYSGEATNIFYEGIRIPPIKLYERGVLQRSVAKLLFENVRLPEERWGDLLACVGACKVGEQRILEMVARYGREQFEASVATNLDRAERRIRGAIRQLPDGSYHAEDYMEFFTEGRFDPGLIALELRIEGDEMVADFRRSSAQLPGVVNSTAAVALAGVVITVKSALDPSGPINGGVFRPISCLTSPGSIVDVSYDAPANAHGEVRKRIISVMLAALGKAAPELVTGDLCGTSFPNVFGGWDDIRGKPFVHLASPAGGNGGFLEHDGPDALGNVDVGNLPTQHPSEELESTFPIVVDEVALRPDSEGAGRRRGGTGIRVRVRLLAEAAEYSLTCDRAVIPPWGIFGGMAASPIFNLIESTDGSVLAFHTGKISSYRIKRGETVVLQAAGGGGYGDPLERESEQVAKDVVDGYISRARANDRYGVVLADQGGIDEEKTARRRSDLREARHHAAVEAAEAEGVYEGIRGRHRVQRLNPAWAQRLGVSAGDLVELTVPSAAPLRAWVRFDDGVSEGVLPLDDLGCWLLGVHRGDRIELRVPSTLNSSNDLEVREGRVTRVAGP